MQVNNKIDTYVLMAVLGIISILSAIPLAPARKSIGIYLDDFLNSHILIQYREKVSHTHHIEIYFYESDESQSVFPQRKAAGTRWINAND